MITPSEVFISAAVEICNQPDWDGAKAYAGNPSLMDGYHMLERARAHLGIRACNAESATAKFFEERPI